MAEGDTILRLARRIEAGLAGRVVTARAPHPRGRAAGVERLDAMQLRSARAIGKHLLITFHPAVQAGGPGDHQLGQQGEVVLHSHLGMSGGWHLYRTGERWRRPESSAWAVLSATGVDLVQFGGPTLRLLRPEQVRRDPTLNSLGPDILAPEPFDLAAAVASIRTAEPATTLGEALLDQRLVAGIGNIFKSEGCFAAKIDPWRRLDELSDDELAAVLATTRDLMNASVAGAPRPAQVYRHAREPCRRCGAPIRSRGQGEGNRTTYWCAGCQV